MAIRSCRHLLMEIRSKEACLDPMARSWKELQSQRTKPLMTPYGKIVRVPASIVALEELIDYIESIQECAPREQINIIVDALSRSREVLTAEQIKEWCYVDVSGNKQLFERLRNHPRLNYDGERFSYKEKLELTGREELMSVITNYHEGIEWDYLEDAYPSVMEDLKALEKECRVLVIHNSDTKEKIVYPNELCPWDSDEELEQTLRELDEEESKPCPWDSEEVQRLLRELDEEIVMLEEMEEEEIEGREEVDQELHAVSPLI